MSISAWVLIVVAFVAGFGWGQFFAERRTKTESAGRIVVSMPLDQKFAADTMRLLAHTIEQVQLEQQEQPQ